MPYNKKLADLNRSGNTGKYPTSIGYFPVLPSLSVSRPKLLLSVGQNSVLYKIQTQQRTKKTTKTQIEKALLS